MNEKISVIVPIYKVEQVLKRCVDSILSQTYENLEIILVDDGSPDQCPAICDAYARQDARIKVVHKKNGGLTSAWKEGVRHAEGEWLGFVDSDDWIDACMVEKMLDFSSDCGKEIICGNYVQEERNRSIEIYQAMEPGIYTGRSLQDRIHGKLLGQEKRPITLSRCMKLFSRTLIVENMKYCDPSIRMGEDMAITLPALLDAQRIVVMEGAAWYHYLFLRESMVHSYDAGMYENIRSLDKIVRQILADKHAPNAQKQADRELQLLMFLEIKNEARNGREGWKGRLQKECRETELQEAVKRMPLAPTVTENKLMYQVLAHPENTVMMQLVHFLLWANSKRQR